MMSDSAIPHMESNTNSSEPAEVNQSAFGEDENPILPDAEVDTVLHFISSPPMHDDTPHFISSSIDEDEVSSSLLLENPQVEVVSDFYSDVLSPFVDYQKVDLLPDDGEVKVEIVGADVFGGSRASVGANLATDGSKVSDGIVDVETDGSSSVIVPLVSSVGVSDASASGDGGEAGTIDVVKETTKSDDITELESLGELDLSVLDSPPKGSLGSLNLQVQLKSEAERLVIVLPSESQLSASEYSWSEIWQQLKQRLNAGDRLRVKNTNVHLVAGDRLLDGRQLQELAESLNQVQLQLKSVTTSRRQTAIASVTSGYSVEQVPLQSNSLSSSKTTATPMKEPLYMEMTIRSGVEIRHSGTVIILGDVNPGGIVVADGDILVWGRLRGVAHAGASGNNDCLIMALQMEPTQLRIADYVARAPEKSPKQFHAEVAYITKEAIRIAKAADFSRSNRIR